MNRGFLLTSVVLSIFLAINVAAAPFYLKGSVLYGNEHNAATGATVTGHISDSHCKFKHMSGMQDEQTCVEHCLDNGAKTVLVDHDQKKVFNLDSEGQKLARKFAARRVIISGHIMEEMIHVEKIEEAQ